MTVHRRDIDGLRAIAVMGVILHHAGVHAVQAGFAGVDVFFVISGFLIGGIVLAERAAGTFSYRAFYARRARRILPALLLVILCSLALGWVLMTPDQLRYFGAAALSALIFVPNIWFYNRIDYFNPAAAEDPLIHTWSLGIEEQFYLALPLLLLGIWRFGPRVRAGVLAGLMLFSLALAVTLSDSHPQQAFYLIHTRAWELLAGVLMAMALPRAGRLGQGSAVGLSLLGLALVLGGMVLIPFNARWPGLWTLIPVTGTCLLMLFGGRAGPARAILSLPPLVWVGLISYSAYLWHQPLLGFLAIVGDRPTGLADTVALIAATLALATLSWALVEQPFRHGFAARPLGRVMLWAGALAIAGFAIGGHVTEGYPARVPPPVQQMLAWSQAVPPSYKSCIGGRAEGDRLDPARACVHGAAGVAPTIAIWGDSHAAVLAAPLGEALAPMGLALRELSGSSCMPVTGVKNTALKRAEYCAVHNRLMLDHMLADRDLKVVVIFSYWNSYAEWRDFDNGIGFRMPDKLVVLPLDAPEGIADDARLAALSAHMHADLAALVAAGKRVIVLEPLPEPGYDLPDQIARRIWQGRPTSQVESYPASAFDDYSRAARRMIADAASGLPDVTLTDLSPLMCQNGQCHLVQDGKPLFFDGNHLSTAGSALIAPALADVIAQAE